MQILFASPEVSPFAKTGGLADVAGSLPKALVRAGISVRVIMPFYRDVKDQALSLESLKSGDFNYLIHRRDGVEYVFVVKDEYYDRKNLYSEPHGDYPDNDLRFSYFSRAIAFLSGEKGHVPDLIHLNDWQTGLVPIYLRMKKSPVKTLFTIHNIGYQGLFKKESLDGIGVPRNYYRVDGIEYYGKISLLKSGIVYSSAVSTVSKGYSREILTPEYGCGMDGILKTRFSDLYGIPNGADYGEWNPAVDTRIIAKYDSGTLDKKEECKKDLIKACGLPAEAVGKPLIGVISRLAEQKGIDLLVESAPAIVKMGASIVILGTGDEKYNRLCENIGRKYPESISSNIRFDNTLAHKIEAGSDFFVMPSRYEPCGLNQLYSMKYGTVPVVRATGGLDDTVNDLSPDGKRGNGIKFRNAITRELTEAMRRGLELYKNKELWRKTQRRIMGLDFSWKASAGKYKELYTKLAA